MTGNQEDPCWSSLIIYSITDPPLRLLRKVLKPVRVGNMMLDLAFIGLAILVSILMQVNRSVFF